MPLSSAQCRAARALLGWSQSELAEASGVPIAVIADFEAETSHPDRSALEAVVSALKTGGVGLVEENGGGAGVRWIRSSQPSADGLRPEELDATNDD